MRAKYANYYQLLLWMGNNVCVRKAMSPLKAEHSRGCNDCGETQGGPGLQVVWAQLPPG